MNEFEQLALNTAAASPCEKRKVGAILVAKQRKGEAPFYFAGVNHHPNGECCELEDGSTKKEVVHAEVSALNDLKQWCDSCTEIPYTDWTLYVTHQPCINCMSTLKNIEQNYPVVIVVKLVEQFMKFDSGKLAYDLIPPKWIELDAEVLTKGAQKYKPNNWRQVKPEEIMRYYSAAMRHIQDWKKFMDGLPEGHLFDDGEMGIGTHHLANARTNLGFLLTLTETLEKAEAIKNG